MKLKELHEAAKAAQKKGEQPQVLYEVFKMRDKLASVEHRLSEVENELSGFKKRVLQEFRVQHKQIRSNRNSTPLEDIPGRRKPLSENTARQ